MSDKIYGRIFYQTSQKFYLPSLQIKCDYFYAVTLAQFCSAWIMSLSAHLELIILSILASVRFLILIELQSGYSAECVGGLIW
jgi:hypothetical protein